jgi:hypothetical protein
MDWIFANVVGLFGIAVGTASLVVAIVLERRSSHELKKVKRELAKNVSEHDERLERHDDDMRGFNAELARIGRGISDNVQTISNTVANPPSRNVGWQKQISGRVLWSSGDTYFVWLQSSKDGDRVTVRGGRVKLHLTTTFLRWREENISDRNAVGPSIEKSRELVGKTIIEKDISSGLGTGLNLIPDGNERQFAFEISPDDIRTSIEKNAPGSTLGKHSSKHWLAGDVILEVSCGDESDEFVLKLEEK